MRPEVEKPFKERDWVALLDLEAAILERGDTAELRALAEAHLYTTSYPQACRLFRAVLPNLTGRPLAAALVNGAVALWRMGDYHTALEWVSSYLNLETRPYDGPAYEIQAHVLWRMGRPLDEVRGAFEQALALFSGDPVRYQRTVIDLAELLTAHGRLDEADQLLDSVDLINLRGYVLGGRARIAAARGDSDSTYDRASLAIRLLFMTVDQFGSIIEEIAELHLLLASVVTGPSRDMFLSAAHAAAVQLQCPPLLDKVQAQALRREV